MKNISREDAYELLEKFIFYRDKIAINNSKSKKVHAEYEKYLAECAEKFDYLITMKTNRYKSFPNHEDLRQDGRVALMLALKSYKMGKGDFFWWAHKYIDTRITRSANNHSTLKIPIHKAKEMQPHKVSQIPVLIDSDEDVFNKVEELEKKNKIKEALAVLPDDQKKIIELAYGVNGIKQHSVSNISRLTGMPVNDCMKILTKAKKTLRPILENLIS